jgi:hypothetical protein
MVTGAGVGNTDSGSTMYHVPRIACHSRSPANSLVTFWVAGHLSEFGFQSLSPKGGVSDLKGAAEQQHGAQWDKEDSDAGIVFEVQYTGKQKADR